MNKKKNANEQTNGNERKNESENAHNENVRNEQKKGNAKNGANEVNRADESDMHDVLTSVPSLTRRHSIARDGEPISDPLSEDIIALANAVSADVGEVSDERLTEHGDGLLQPAANR